MSNRKLYAGVLFQILLLLVTVAIGFGQNASSSDGFLWKQDFSGKRVLTLHTIPDANDDGHEDVVVVAVDSISKNCSLYLLDGKTGNITRTNGPLSFQPLEALVIESPLTRIAVAYSAGARWCEVTGVKVYDTLLTEVADFQTEHWMNGYPPSNLQTFSGNEIAFFYYYTDDVHRGDYLDCYSLLTNSLQWRSGVSIHPYPNWPWLGWEAWTMIDLLALNSTRMLLLSICPHPLDNRVYEWLANIYADNGTVISSVEDFGGPLGTEISSAPRFYNGTHFLYICEQNEVTYLRLSTINGSSELVAWNTEVFDASGNNGFPIVDVNQDGVTEVVTIIDGHLAVLDGKDGMVIYTVQEVSASSISDVAIVSDVNNDTIPEVVVHADKSYLISFEPSNCQILWQQDFGSNGVDTIQDVSGDGYRDVVAATGSQISCFFGSVPTANNDPDQPVNEFPSLLMILPFIAITLLAVTIYQKSKRRSLTLSSL